MTKYTYKTANLVVTVTCFHFNLYENNASNTSIEDHKKKSIEKYLQQVVLNKELVMRIWKALE